MANSTNDVISIESSDSDPDCQIVEVIPSPAKRGKNKSRWQNKLSSKTQLRSREMTMNQLDKPVYEDRPSMSSASKGYARRLSVDLTAVGCGLQGTNSSKTDHLPDTESNDAVADAVPHVDLEDPFSVQRYINDDSEAASISFPCLAQSVECKQEPCFEDGDEDEDEDEDEDGQRSTRSRSGSTATLDFSPDRESYNDSDKDTHGIVWTFDEAPQSTGLTDTRDCATLDTMRKVLHNNGYLTPADEASSERSDPFISKMELQDEKKVFEGDLSFEPIYVTLQPHKEASKSGHQLPQAGRWDSVVNVAAFKALPGPLFTRPKQILDVITYESMMEERAAQEAKERRKERMQ